MKTKLLILTAVVFPLISPDVVQARPLRPVVAPRVVGHPVATVIRVQRVLTARGLYRGGVDGIMGPGTRAGIRTYQARHGLAVTGDITPGLLRSMGL
jgi:membrane-bound lytic murein transglycosylase B